MAGKAHHVTELNEVGGGHAEQTEFAELLPEVGREFINAVDFGGAVQVFNVGAASCGVSRT